MVQFEGQWMTPSERDAILEERDDRFNELMRLDAERRARDAEERAADAEARAQQATLDAAVGGIPLYYGSGYVVGGYPSWTGMDTAMAGPGTATSGGNRPAQSGRRWECIRTRR